MSAAYLPPVLTGGASPELCALAWELHKKERRAPSCALSLKYEAGSEDPRWAQYVPPVLAQRVQ